MCAGEIWETAHLPLPKLNVNIYVLLGQNVGLGEGYVVVSQKPKLT